MTRLFTWFALTLTGLGVAGCGGGEDEPEPLEGAPSASPKAHRGHEVEATAIDQRLGRAAIDDWLGQADMAVRFHFWTDCVRYVDGSVSSSGDGLVWDRAFRTVQEGIDAAHQAVEDEPGVGQCEVWVARGTYYIYVDSPQDTVLLKPGAAVYGGFVGYETTRAYRNWASYLTELSGYDEGGSGRVHHVVTGSDEAVLDGFTVTGGWAAGSSPHDCGAGMFNYVASPTVRNCTFSANYAAHHGGGMYNNHSSPTVTGCEFSDNAALSEGGGMYNVHSSPTVTGCTFSANATVDVNSSGGGMSNDNSSPTVTSCTFLGNTTNVGPGGGMHNLDSSPFVSNCTFLSNTADNGGGMSNSHASPTLESCTLSGNYAMSNGGGMYNESGSPTVHNCILWGNAASEGPEIYNEGSAPTVVYSNVQGGYSGAGNIDADPLFVSQEGGNLHLGGGSPCIDAANGLEAPDTDLDGNDRVDDPFSPNTGLGPPWADMGAYEYQPIFSVSIATNQPVYCGGDPFVLELHTINMGEPVEVARFVVLDVGNGQDYWFWPNWVHFPPDFAYVKETLPTGFNELQTILDFEWPADAGEGSGMIFWAALMSPDLSEIYAIDACEFSFSEGEGPIGQPRLPQWLGSETTMQSWEEPR